MKVLNKAKELFSKSNKNLDDIKNILNYRCDENKYEESILQTKDDPYITLFNFSFDTENGNNIYLNSYPNNEVIELKYDL